jgi:hypothetical protein
MAEPGDNGDGEPQEVEVQVEQVTEPEEKGPARELLENLVEALLRRAFLLVGKDEETAKVRLTKEERLELKELAVMIGRVGNFIFPKLAALHQLREDSEGFFARMQATFSTEDARKALVAQEQRLRYGKAVGRPPRSPAVDPHDR